MSDSFARNWCFWEVTGLVMSLVSLHHLARNNNKSNFSLSYSPGKVISCMYAHFVLQNGSGDE